MKVWFRWFFSFSKKWWFFGETRRSFSEEAAIIGLVESVTCCEVQRRWWGAASTMLLCGGKGAKLPHGILDRILETQGRFNERTSYFFVGVGGALSNKSMFEQCVASQIGATVFLENHIKTISFCLEGGYSIQLPNVSRVDPSGIGTGKVTKEKDQENWLR